MKNVKKSPAKVLVSPRSKLYLAVAAQLMLSASAYAVPTGGKIIGGDGVIDQNGLNTTITQNTDRLSLDWDSFNIEANERVEFVQPDSSSVALNRILSNDATHIFGQLDANGHVILMNPNGIIFGENATVNVGGLVASGLAINPDDFMNGDFAFSAVEGTNGAVINRGMINAATGGNVALMGKSVVNEGLISAKLGTVTLAAGKESVLTFDDRGMLGVRVTEEVLQNELGVDAAVRNSGEIQAEGGKILLTGSASQDIFTKAVNAGDLNADTSVVVHEDGSFTLGGGADVVNTGTLDVASATADAGDIVILGENITHSGNILADSHGTGSAGHVEVHSLDTTLLTESSTISATATNAGEGGDIKLLGERVGVFDQSKIDASGIDGGGDINIGGGFQGKNSQLRNATRTVVTNETEINANAIENGDGGNVIIWADQTTAFTGEINVRGGDLSGNGGFVEVSGKENLKFDGRVDRTAVAGESGTLLLDPENILINPSTFGNANDDAELNTSADDPGILFDDRLGENLVIGSTALGMAVLQGDVILEATGSITTENPGAGFEFIEGGIFGDTAVNNANSLTLNAGQSIIFDGRTTFDLASGNLLLNAGGDIILSGGIYNPPGGTPTPVTATLRTKGDIVLDSGANIQMDGSIFAKTISLIAANTIEVGDSDTAIAYLSAGDLSASAERIVFTEETSIDVIDPEGSGNVELNAILGLSIRSMDVAGDIVLSSSAGAIDIINSDISIGGGLTANAATKIDVSSSNIISTSAQGPTSFSFTAGGDLLVGQLGADFSNGGSLPNALNISTQSGGVTTFSSDIYTNSGRFDAAAGSFIFTNEISIDAGGLETGDISIVSAQDVDLPSMVSGGGVTVESTSGSVMLSEIISAFGDIRFGSAGHIELSEGASILTAGGNVWLTSAQEIRSQSFLPSDVVVETAGSLSMVSNSTISLRGIYNAGSNIDLTSAGGSLFGGQVELNTNGAVTADFQNGNFEWLSGYMIVNSSSFSAIAGNLLMADVVLNTSSVNGSGDITLTALGNTNGNASAYSIWLPTINPDNNVATGDLTVLSVAPDAYITYGLLDLDSIGITSAALNVSGSITIDAVGDINLPDIDSLGLLSVESTTGSIFTEGRDISALGGISLIASADLDISSSRLTSDGDLNFNATLGNISLHVADVRGENINLTAVGSITAGNGIGQPDNIEAADSVSIIAGDYLQMGGISGNGFNLSAQSGSISIDAQGVGIAAVAVKAAGDISISSSGLVNLSSTADGTEGISLAYSDFDYGQSLTISSINPVSLKASMSFNYVGDMVGQAAITSESDIIFDSQSEAVAPSYFTGITNIQLSAVDQLLLGAHLFTSGGYVNAEVGEFIQSGDIFTGGGNYTATADTFVFSDGVQLNTDYANTADNALTGTGNVSITSGTDVSLPNLTTQADCMDFSTCGTLSVSSRGVDQSINVSFVEVEGILDVAGRAQFDIGQAGALALGEYVDNNLVNFGERVDVTSAGSVNIDAASGFELGPWLVAGDASIVVINANTTLFSNSALQIQGSANFGAGAPFGGGTTNSVISLLSTESSFGELSIAGGQADIRYSGDLVLGNIQLSGGDQAIPLVSTFLVDGSVTQVGDISGTILTLSPLAYNNSAPLIFDVTGDLTLDSATNQISSLEIVNAQNATITNSIQLALGNVTANNLTFTGSADQNNNAVVTVADQLIVNLADGGIVKLDNYLNSFASISVNPGLKAGLAAPSDAVPPMDSVSSFSADFSGEVVVGDVIMPGGAFSVQSDLALPGVIRQADNAWFIAGGTTFQSEDIYLGGSDGLSSITLTGGLGPNHLNANFRGDLLFNGVVESTSSTPVTLSINGNVTDNILTISNTSEWTGLFNTAGQAYLGEGTDTVNIERNVPFVFNLVGGNNTVNLLAPDLSLNLIGGTGVDTLNAYSSDQTWTVDQTGSGALQSDANPESSVAFTGFENLVGGEVDDVFFLSAYDPASPISISAGGGTGFDVVDYSQVVGTLDITVGNDGSLGGVSGAEKIIGNYDGSFSIIRPSSTDASTVDWQINGVFSENSLAIDGGSPIVFENFNQITGGAGVNTFTILGDFIVNGAGGIIGGGGENTFVLAAPGVSVDTLQGFGLSSSLVAYDDNNLWTIGNFGSGSLQSGGGLIEFTDMENFTGGTLTDDFVIEGINPQNYVIDGQEGSDSITLVNGLDSIWTLTSISDGIIAFAEEEIVYHNTQVLVGQATVFNSVVDATADSKSWSVGGPDGTLVKDMRFPGISLMLNQMDTMTAGSGDDELLLNASYEGEIHGGAGNDHFIQQNANISANLFGDDGLDTLTRYVEGDATWTIDGQNAGSLTLVDSLADDIINFTDVENLVGDSGIDHLVFAAGGGIGTVMTGADDDTLTLAEGATYTLIDGGTGQNSLALAGDSATVNVRGEAQINDAAIINFIAQAKEGAQLTVIGLPDADAEWFITGDGIVSVMVDGVTYEHQNVVDLQGSIANDTFVLQQGGQIAGQITAGQGGTDTLRAENGQDNQWTLDGADSGLLAAQSDGSTLLFQSIAHLVGGEGNDTFDIVTGGSISGSVVGLPGGIDTVSISNPSLTNTWILGDVNSVSSVGADGAISSFTFSGIQSLAGNVNLDTFDMSAMAGSVDLKTGTAGGLSVSGMDHYISAGGAFAGADSNSDWILDFTGTTSYVDSEGVQQTVSFTDFRTFTGGNGADTFIIQGVWRDDTIQVIGVEGEGTIDSVQLDLPYANAAWSFNSSDNTAVYVDGPENSYLSNLSRDDALEALRGSSEQRFGLIGIEDYRGGGGSDSFFVYSDNDLFAGEVGFNYDIDGGDGDDYIFGFNWGTPGDILWALTESFGGALNRAVSFSNIENVRSHDFLPREGAALTSTFDVAPGVSFTRLIGNSTADSFIIGEGALVGSVEGGLGIDTLFVGNIEKSWIINETEGTVGATAFTGVEGLLGGTGADTFNVTSAATEVTNIDGGSIDGQDRIIGPDTANVWAIAAADNNAGTLNDALNFINIGTIQGGTGVDTITGAGVVGDQITWDITGDYQGTYAASPTATLTFEQVENIEGSDANDVVTFAQNVAFGNLTLNGGDDEVTLAQGIMIGDILGGTGVNTLYTGSLGSAIYVDGSQYDATATYAAQDFIIDNTGAGPLTVYAFADSATTWTIDADGQVTVLYTDAGGNAGTHVHNGVARLEGSTGQDDFILLAGGALADGISGGADGADSLTANNGQDNIWTINGTDSGNLTAQTDGTSLIFEGINNLIGGANTDIFDIATGGSLSGSVSGVLNSADAVAGTIDELHISSNDFENTWALGATNSVSMTDAAATNVELAFSNIQNIIGNDNNDRFTFTGDTAVANLDGGLGSNTVAWSNGDVVVNLANATVSGGATSVGVAGITRYEANLANLSRIIGWESNNVWQLSAADAGAVEDDAGNSVAFSGFNALQGGALFDTLVSYGYMGTTQWTAGANEVAVNFSDSAGSLLLAEEMEHLIGSSADDQFTVNVSQYLIVDGDAGNNQFYLVPGEVESHNLVDWQVGLLGGRAIGEIDTIEFRNINKIGSGVTGSVNNFSINTLATAITEYEVFDGAAGDVSFMNAQNPVLLNLANTEFVFTGITSFEGNGAGSEVIGSNTGSTWSIDTAGIINQDDTITYSNFATVRGGEGADQFVVTGTPAIDLIGGEGTGIDTLQAGDMENIWTISDTSSTLNSLAFAGMEVLRGGALVDTMTVAAGATVNDIFGGTGADTFTFGEGASVNNLNAGLGADTVTLGDNVVVTGALLGGDEADVVDTLDISAFTAAIEYNFDTKATSNGLVYDQFEVVNNPEGLGFFGGAGDTRWIFTDADSFYIEKLDANGALLETSPIYAGEYNSVRSGAGRNEFILADDSNFNGTISGDSAGENSLQSGDLINQWLITGANAGSVSDGTVTTLFSNIAQLIGSDSAADTFTLVEGGSIAAINAGASLADTLALDHGLQASWNLGTGTEQVMVDADTSTFNGIDTVLGSEGGNAFIFAGDLSEITRVQGGSGTDTLNVTGLNQTVQVNLQEASVAGIAFENIESYVADSAQGNTFIGLDAAANWTITADDTGSVSYDGGTVSYAFSGFTSATGGIADDHFSVTAAPLAGMTDGGAGSNNLTAANTANAWTLGETSSTLNTRAFRNIQAVSGGDAADSFVMAAAAPQVQSVEGGLGDNTLAGFDQDSTWTINADNGGTVTGLAAFSSIQSYNGGSAIDTFNVAENTTFNTIDSGAGDDIVNIASGVTGGSILTQAGSDLLTMEGTVTLASIDMGTDGAADTSVDILDITDVDVGDETAQLSDAELIALLGFTLTGHEQFIRPEVGIIFAGDGYNIWHITGENEGYLVRTDVNGNIEQVNFSNKHTLRGGTGQDVFVFANDGAAVTTVIDGGAGDNTIALTWSEGGDASVQNLINEWLISGENQGSFSNEANIEGTVFSGIASIIGGGNSDNFVFSDGAMLSGVLDGGAGQDTVDLQALNRDLYVRLDDLAIAPAAEQALTMRNINTLTANAQQQTTLLGASDQAYSWVINGARSGEVTTTLVDENNQLLAFENITAITGGDHDDLFQVLSNNGTVLLDGGNALTMDRIDYSQINANVHVELASLNGFEHVRGNNAGVNAINSAELAAMDGVNTWTIGGSGDGINDGQLTSGGTIIQFEDFNLLTGGAEADTFNQANGVIIGEVRGSAGNDVMNVDVAGSNRGTVFIGGADNDTLNVRGATAQTGLVYTAAANGGEFTYTLDDASYAIGYEGAERINELSQATAIEIRGTAAVDNIAVRNNSFSINNSAAVNHTNKNDVLVRAGISDFVEIADNINLVGTFGVINATIVSNDLGNTSIVAQQLLLESTRDMGAFNARIRTNVDDLTLVNVTGDVFLQEQNGLNLAAVNSSGELDLVLVNGNLTNSGVVSTSNDVRVLATDGDITLTGNNQLQGNLTLSGNAVEVHSAGAMNIASLTAQSLNLVSQAGITATGPVHIAGETMLSAVTDIVMVNELNDFNRLAITQARDVSLVDQNGIELAGINTSGRFSLRAGGIVIDGDITTGSSTELISGTSIEQNASITSGADIDASARNGDVVVADGVITQGVNVTVSASGNLQLQDMNGESINISGGELVVSGGDLVASNGSINVESGSFSMNVDTIISAGDGSIRIAATDNIVTSNDVSGGSVSISGNDVTIDGNVTAGNGSVDVAGDTNLTVNRDITATTDVNVSSSQGSVSQTGNISSDTGSVSVAAGSDGNVVMGADSITRAKAGDVSISAGQEVVVGDVQSSGTVTIGSEKAGIIDGNGDGTNVTADKLVTSSESGLGASDAFETKIGTVDSKTNIGDINISNEGDIKVDQLATTGGNIGIKNNDGDVTLGTGSIVATGGEGGSSVDIDVNHGSVKTDGPQNVATIKTDKVTISAPSGSVGEGGLNVDAREIIISARSKAGALIVKPGTDLVEYFSGSFKFEDQLLAVEPLEEVNPAVFTNVQGYFYNDISLRLPADQRYDEEEE